MALIQPVQILKKSLNTSRNLILYIHGPDFWYVINVCSMFKLVIADFKCYHHPLCTEPLRGHCDNIFLKKVVTSNLFSWPQIKIRGHNFLDINIGIGMFTIIWSQANIDNINSHIIMYHYYKQARHDWLK